MHPSLPGGLPLILSLVARNRPRWALAVLGALMIVPVMLAGTVAVPLAGLFEGPKTQLFMIAFAGSSLPEELMRLAVLYFVGMRWLGIARPRDGLIFGLLVSLGFSCAENIYYAISIGWATGVLKLAIATPIHLALGATMGCLLAAAAAEAPERRRPHILLALAAPVLTHGVYDLTILTALTNSGADAAPRLALPALCYALVVAIAVLAALRARHSGPATAA